MNAVSLNNLWSYLQGLSLSASNQCWLGERLIEASKAAKKGKSANVSVRLVHQREIVKVPFTLPDGQILPHPALILSEVNCPRFLFVFTQ
ncbi:MAG: hypothetical protein J5502_00980 [Prevotella sp.]|nr:hypothetical protein [Prevotella sp.]